MRQIFSVAGMLAAVMLVATYFVLTAQLPCPERETNQHSDIVVIDMTTRSWRFDPTVVSGKEIASASSSPSEEDFADTKIRLKKCSKVTIHITNLDPNQPHGFGLPDLGVQSVANPPQQTVEVKFLADKEGSFTFLCTVFCGRGHPRHKGTLIVEA